MGFMKNARFGFGVVVFFQINPRSLLLGGTQEGWDWCPEDLGGFWLGFISAKGSRMPPGLGTLQRSQEDAASWTP